MNHESSPEENAILVGTVLPSVSRWEVDDFLNELEMLAKTAGAAVVKRVVQDRSKIDPAYFIGRGKVEALASIAKQKQASLVLFDDDLSPAQLRNLEKIIKVKIVDRTGLILDIFAHRAKTREAKTQVELAQLTYLLPRLTRQWTHLSRQVGGIGVRGPGETQLEVDRRLIRKRIKHLKEDLLKIEKQRNTQRNHRENIFKIALIGYTNVGKSTLLNVLSGADVFVEDLLFATLDSTVRAVQLSDHHKILFADTVGFIRKLPTNLVASFKSTLEESADADLLLHVVDISHPKFEEQMKAVNSILSDLKLHKIPILIVFNKVDKIKETGILLRLKEQFPQSIFISAIRRIRLEKLKNEIIKLIENSYIEKSITIPADHTKLIAQIYENARIVNKTYINNSVRITFRGNLEIVNKIEKWVTNIDEKESISLQSK